MRILQLIPAFKPGGAERSALEIGDALHQAGHASLIVGAAGPWSQLAKQRGLATVELAVGHKGPAFLPAVFRLGAVLRDFRPDIVHARSRLPAWAAWWNRGQFGQAQLLTTLHGLNSVSRYSAVMTYGARAIAVSESCRRYWLDAYPALRPEQVHVIERGIDPAAYPPRRSGIAVRAELLPTAGSTLRKQPMLLLPGRGTRLKGHAAALQLLRSLCARGIDAWLYCPGLIEPGRDAYLRELLTMARSLAVDDRFVPALARSDLPALYATADVVLQLSQQPESFGRTVIEALHVGAPVVGFAHGGVGELLGRLQPQGAVALHDSDALSAAVIAALRGEFAPVCGPIPTLQSMQQQTLDLYADMLCNPRP